ncbi:vitelline membrane protein Vm34Ca [Drosophila ananassae]|nr:vitelline membrane protein Vm34Ca [Drosophila ananassae]
MKCIAIVATFCLLAAYVAADKDDKMLGSSYGGGYGKPAAAPAYAAPAAPAYSAAPAAPAAPAYSAPVSIPAPPCPKNYLFSCQPNLAPVPCSAPAPSYGSAGAYSQYAPVYAHHAAQW